MLLYFFIFFMFATIISLYLSPNFNLFPHYFIFICFFNWVFFASFIPSTRIFFLLFIYRPFFPSASSVYLPSFLFTSSSLLSISTSLASLSTYSIFSTSSLPLYTFLFPLVFIRLFPLTSFFFPRHISPRLFPFFFSLSLSLYIFASHYYNLGAPF